ncbi:hypothetical protein DFH09DRAFT_1083980 [Mycena vulgaris]|nr:hypothetical protein DFH09DRAFT_1083980 [Mycena vulgaris]
MYDGGMGKDVKAIGSQYSQEGWRARRKSRGQQGLRYGARGGMHPHRRDVTYVGAPTLAILKSEMLREIHGGVPPHHGAPATKTPGRVFLPWSLDSWQTPV